VIILKHTYRIDVMHAGDTRQTTEYSKKANTFFVLLVVDQFSGQLVKKQGVAKWN
jgi:hypothetical protein